MDCHKIWANEVWGPHRKPETDVVFSGNGMPDPEFGVGKKFMVWWLKFLRDSDPTKTNKHVSFGDQHSGEEFPIMVSAWVWKKPIHWDGSKPKKNTSWKVSYVGVINPRNPKTHVPVFAGGLVCFFDKNLGLARRNSEKKICQNHVEPFPEFVICPFLGLENDGNPFLRCLMECFVCKPI